MSRLFDLEVSQEKLKAASKVKANILSSTRQKSNPSSNKRISSGLLYSSSLDVQTLTGKIATLEEESKITPTSTWESQGIIGGTIKVLKFDTPVKFSVNKNISKASLANQYKLDQLLQLGGRVKFQVDIENGNVKGNTVKGKTLTWDETPYWQRCTQLCIDEYKGMAGKIAFPKNIPGYPNDIRYLKNQNTGKERLSVLVNPKQFPNVSSQALRVYIREEDQGQHSSAMTIISGPFRFLNIGDRTKTVSTIVFTPFMSSATPISWVPNFDENKKISHAEYTAQMKEINNAITTFVKCKQSLKLGGELIANINERDPRHAGMHYPGLNYAGALKGSKDSHMHYFRADGENIDMVTVKKMCDKICKLAKQPLMSEKDIEAAFSDTPPANVMNT